MALLQKVVLFVVVIASVILTLLPYTRASSQEQSESETINSYTKHNKLSPQLSFDITVHGILLWASMGLLMPVGILVIRMANREECGRRLKIMFYTHAILQIVSVLLATAGAVLSIRKFENSFNNNHQRMGLALYGVIWLQGLLGFFRPQRGNEGRSLWFLLHWSLGTAIPLLGIINIYTGLHAYHKKSSKSTKLYTTIFTAEICFIAFMYLLQDKWNYIKKQGVVLGDAPIQPTDQEIITPTIEEAKICFSRGSLRKLMLYSE